MMKNVTKTNNKTVLLAILAVFAMIAAGAAVVMASSEVQAVATDADETDTEASVPYVKETGAIAGASVIVDMTAATADVELTVNANATIYVLEGTWASGCDLTIKAGTAGDATIYVAKSVSATTGSVTVTYYKNVSATLVYKASAVADIAVADSTPTAGPIINVKETAAWTSYNTSTNFGLMYEDAVAKSHYYFAKGAVLPKEIVIPDTKTDVVTIKEATGTVNKMNGAATPAIQSQITFEGLTTETAFVITGDGDAGDDPIISGGHATAMTGSITVVKGTVVSEAALGAAVGTVLNAVSDEGIGAAATFAPSMTAAVALNPYTFAYGTANLYYKDAAVAADATITLVNSSAVISVDVKKTAQYTATITTAAIDATIVIDYGTADIASVTLNAAPVAGAASSSVKIADTTLEGITLGTAVAYDLIVDKDAIVGGGLIAAFTGKVSVKTDGVFVITTAATFSKDIEVRGTLFIDDVNMTVNDSAVNLYGILSGDDLAASMLTIATTGETKKASFKAYSGSSITNTVQIINGGGDGTVTIDTSGAMSTAYLKGTVSSNQTFSQSQNVVVDGDLEIVNGAEITIAGGFQVEDGVTMTIIAGIVTVSSSTATVNIIGDVEIEELGFFVVDDALSVNITGSIVNEGTASFDTKDAKIKDGGSVVSTEDGLLLIEAITVEKGGILQIEGAITEILPLGQDTTITNKGTVVFKGADLAANDVYVNMVAEGAVVDVQSMIRSDADAFVLIISDDDYAKPSSATAKSASSQITIDPMNVALIGVGGFTVTETAATVTVGTDKFFYPGMTVTGSAAVIVDSSYAGIADNKKATITLSEGATADANVKFADRFIVGAGVTLDVDCALTVDGNMTFVGAAAPLQAVLDITGGVLTVTGTIVYDKNMTETGFANGTLNAVKLEIGPVADPVKYLTSLDNAVEIIEDIEDSVTMTLYGTNFSVAKSVAVPSNVKLAGTATVTIGSDYDNTVVLTIEDGATVAAGLTIVVKGSLYAENYKDLKTTSITADVKTTDGTEVLYTNLYSAVEGAETGDIVEVTNDITITKSFTVKAGVIMNIPGGFTATVNPANKVTITVNGVLCTDSTIAVTGGEWAADGVATDKKAVLAVNGTFMTGESADTTGAAVNAIYHVAGAYYYLSDEVGSFVYVGSLADALLTSVKSVYIYETVYEYNAVTVGSGKTVTVANGAVLNATDISLLKSKIVTAGTGALNATVTAAAGADGTAVLSVSKYAGDIVDTYSETEKVYSVEIDEIVGTITIASGIVDVTADATAADSILTVMSDAYLYVPAGETLTFSNGYQTIFGTVFVDGTLILNNAEKLAIDGEVAINHDADALTDGKLTVSKQIALTSGSIVIADDVPAANVNFNANVILGNEPDSVGATAGVYGKVRLADNAVIIAYPDGNVEDLLINPDLEGADHSKATAFMINDVAYMIVFGTEASTVTYAQVLAIPEFDLPAYADDFTDATTWGLTAAGTVGSKLVGEADVVATPVQITISVVTGLQVFVDGVKYNSGATPLLTIGTHTVQVMVSPGYKMADGSTPSVTFAGKAVTGIMAITVTSDMVNPVLSVIGDVVVDQPDIPEQEKEDNSMIMILLGVLVVMVVILAIVTVIRMMRS